MLLFRDNFRPEIVTVAFDKPLLIIETLRQQARLVLFVDPLAPVFRCLIISEVDLWRLIKDDLIVRACVVSR